MSRNGHRFELPYGRGGMQFELPASWVVEHASPREGSPLSDPMESARRALQSPLGSPPLRELAREARSAAVVITDATRPCPDALFVPLLLQELEAGGIPRAAMTVVFALGMHRSTTTAEQREKLGSAFGTVQIRDAQGGRHEEYRSLGTLNARDLDLPEEVPVFLHRAVLDADLVVATGLVEPHQYAGYSGGRKTVAIGCASARTIGVLHGIPFLEHPGTILGSLRSNPVHRALEAIAARAGLRFVINVALDAGGRPVAMAAGEPQAVLASLAATLEPLAWTPVLHTQYDAVLAGVGHPKDDNLYQASRALTYLAFSPAPVVRRGGWIILAAACPEGAGKGPGEREFLALMSAGATPAEVLSRIREHGFGAGGQRAFMVARALERYEAGIIGAAEPAEVSACHMAAFASPAAMAEHVAPDLGERASVLVVPHGLATLPLAGSHPGG